MNIIIIIVCEGGIFQVSLACARAKDSIMQYRILNRNDQPRSGSLQGRVRTTRQSNVGAPNLYLFQAIVDQTILYIVRYSLFSSAHFYLYSILDYYTIIRSSPSLLYSFLLFHYRSSRGSPSLSLLLYNYRASQGLFSSLFYLFLPWTCGHSFSDPESDLLSCLLLAPRTG